MIIKVVATIALSALGGILYRMGGSDHFNTKTRDLGVPAVGIGLLWILGGWNWWLILCFGLYFGSMTTYWKNKPDAVWWNWLLVGLGFSLAFVPYAIATGHWMGFWLRLVLLPVSIMLWSEKNGNAVWEEFGRGFATTSSIPLLLI